MHMQNGSITVRNGAHVNQEQMIGRVGSTGRSSGPHLHFEVIREGRHENPRAYLNVVRGADAIAALSLTRPMPMARDPQEASRYYQSLRRNRGGGVGTGSLIMINGQPSPYSPSSFFPSPTPRSAPRSRNPSFADIYLNYHGTNR